MNKKQQIANKIEEFQDIIIFHHKNIDGDSLSSSYGLLLAIKKKYPQKNVKMFLNKEEMALNFPWFEYKKEFITEKAEGDFLGIIGDTSTINKTSKYDELIKAKFIICFDHHRNGIDIKHDLFWSEPEFSASSMQAIEIAKSLKVEFDEEIAFTLLIGLITDTGSFSYSLDKTEPVRYFADMLDHISRQKMDWFWNNMKKRTQQDIEVIKMLYTNIKYDGQVAYTILDEEICKCYATINIKNKIHAIGNIVDYPIWAMFYTETSGDEKWLKMHFRSNRQNVSQIAIKHGGGGHNRAAGAKIKYTENGITKILKELNALQ